LHFNWLFFYFFLKDLKYFQPIVPKIFHVQDHNTFENDTKIESYLPNFNIQKEIENFSVKNLRTPDIMLDSLVSNLYNYFY
jgi:hypothetical protein